MVHGFHYGLQYEINLIKPVDLYNDILSICIGVRNMIQYNITGLDKVSKLIIIPLKNLDKRFQNQEHTKKYINSLSRIKYNGTHMNRSTNQEEFKYYDVKIYNDYIKNNNNLPEPINSEILSVLEKRLDELIDMYDDIDYLKKYSEHERLLLSNERNELNTIIKIQRILIDTDYYNEIKLIYENLTNIQFNSEEQELINKVLNHPNLNGLVSNHGLSLVEYFY